MKISATNLLKQTFKRCKIIQQHSFPFPLHLSHFYYFPSKGLSFLPIFICVSFLPSFFPCFFLSLPLYVHLPISYFPTFFFTSFHPFFISILTYLLNSFHLYLFLYFLPFVPSFSPRFIMSNSFFTQLFPVILSLFIITEITIKLSRRDNKYFNSVYSFMNSCLKSYKSLELKALLF